MMRDHLISLLGIVLDATCNGSSLSAGTLARMKAGLCRSQVQYLSTNNNEKVPSEYGMSCGRGALALFCLSACTRELDIQQAYDFSLEVMPVQNFIAKGETAEMRCSLKRAGRFANTQSITSSLMARVA